MNSKRHPLVEEIHDFPASQQVFEIFKDQPFSFLLDSGMDHQKLGRYSFMGSNPFLILQSKGKEITFIRNSGVEEIFHGNPFDVIDEVLKTYSLGKCPVDIPFSGGAVGYFSYDLGRFIEQLPSNAIDDLRFPECYLGFYDVGIIFDHAKEKAYIVSSGFPEQDEEKRLRRAKQRLQEIKDKLTAIPPERTIELTQESLSEEPIVIHSNFTHDEYIKAVETAREYIIAGDIFQVCLSQRFEANLPISPYELYRKLRLINPAPFASYLNFNGISIVGASPERFLRVQEDTVETRPIKGTRPRGKTPEEDTILAQELMSSTKDKAENMMIVDLERNDLGRLCRFGTVKVTELAILETYPTVFHLTSTVEGKMRAGKTRINLLKATFPGGSITGAPKIRAMEIIDELEPTRRSVYTGSIGYLSFSGEMDLNIVIRTFLIKGKKAYFQVGGAVVYDSNPESEYVETLDKARALLESLNLSSRVGIEMI